jgi:hypothetical protein
MGAQGRLDPFIKRSANGRYLRILAIASQSVDVPLIASPLLTPTRPAPPSLDRGKGLDPARKWRYFMKTRRQEAYVI